MERLRNEKTAKGFLKRTYAALEKSKKSLAAREAFFAWAIIDPDFMALFRDWTVAGWPRDLIPTVGRIDASKGYLMGNIRWRSTSLKKAS